METKGNDPAMPVQHADGTFKGMTIRERFAMAAMQGLMSFNNKGIYTWPEMVEKAAEISVSAADALIEALSR